MEIKKLANNAINFSINRFIEILAIIIVVIGVLLLISLVSFSPNDPNFIFPEGTVIKNFLGYRGSFSSDLFFQSFGLTALLIPLSLIFTGINIILSKKIFFIICIYCLALYSFLSFIQIHLNSILMVMVVLLENI